jgi:hypothetical protein
MDRLAPRAQARYGIRVTNQIFGDWLREKLIATPSKRGRVRDWTWQHYRVALEICRLKSQGVNFAGIIRWNLWIKGFNPPDFDPTKQRRSLLKEFRRIRKLAVEPIYSTYDPRDTDDVSDKRAAKIALSMGNQDERLKPILPLGIAELVDARNLAQFDVMGKLIQNAAHGFLARQLQAMAPSIPAEKIELAGQHMAGDLVPLLGGFLGEINEIEAAGEHSIQIADRSSFEIARNMLINLSHVMKMLGHTDTPNLAGYSAVALSATHPDWRVGNFVSYLHLLHRGGPNFLDNLVEKIAKNVKDVL